MNISDYGGNGQRPALRVRVESFAEFAKARLTYARHVLDLVVAHKVAFDEEDERQGRPIAQVASHEYDAILQMIIAAQR